MRSNRPATSHRYLVSIIDASGETHKYTGLHYRAATLDQANAEATAGIRYAARLLNVPPIALLAVVNDVKGNEVARILGASTGLPAPLPEVRR